MPLLEDKELQVSDISTPVGDDSEQKQRRQMLIDDWVASLRRRTPVINLYQRP